MKRLRLCKTVLKLSASLSTTLVAVSRRRVSLKPRDSGELRVLFSVQVRRILKKFSVRVLYEAYQQSSYTNRMKTITLNNAIIIPFSANLIYTQISAGTRTPKFAITYISRAVSMKVVA